MELPHLPFTEIFKARPVRSITADVTNSQNYADTDPGGDTGSAQGYTADNTATDTTVRGSVNPPAFNIHNHGRLFK